MANEKKSPRKVKMSTCMMCGMPLTQAYTWHHVIPQKLSPSRNLLVPLHFECHQRLNSLYVNNLPKPKLNQSATFVGHARNLKMASKRFSKVVENICEQIEQNFRDLKTTTELEYTKQKLGIKE